MPKNLVITKGKIVDLAASLAGVTGTLVGASNYDVNAALMILEFLMVHLEEKHGIFLGFKRAERQEPQPSEDSGLTDTNCFSVATLLAYQAHAIFGIDPVTYQRIEIQSIGLINRLSPIETIEGKSCPYLPAGAGYTRYNSIFGNEYFSNHEKIDIEDDSTLDLGIDYSID